MLARIYRLVSKEENNPNENPRMIDTPSSFFELVGIYRLVSKEENMRKANLDGLGGVGGASWGIV